MDKNEGDGTLCKSDGQGNYKVCVQSNGLYVAGCTFPAAPVGAEGEITVVVSEMFLGAVNALASLDADEFSIEIKEDRVIVALGTGEVEVPVIKEPKHHLSCLACIRWER